MKNKLAFALCRGLLVSLILSSCQGKDISDNPEKDGDATKREPYKNKSTKDEFMLRSNDLTTLLQSIEQTFYYAPQQPQAFTLQSAKNLSAIGILRAFAGQQKTHSLQLQQSRASSFAGLVARTPEFGLPDNFKLISVGASCADAVNLLNVGYGATVDYAQNVVDVIKATDDNNLPNSVTKLDSQDFASIYQLDIDVPTGDVVSKGKFQFGIGSDDTYVNIQSAGNLVYESKQSPSDSGQLTSSTRVFANTSNKNIDVAASYSTKDEVYCGTTKAEMSSLAYYKSVINLGKTPKITDSFSYPSDNSKPGYQFSVKNAECIFGSPQNFSNYTIGGAYRMTVEKTSETTLTVTIEDQMQGVMQKNSQTQPQQIASETYLTWTLVNEGGACTVTNVVDHSQNNP